MHPTHTPATTDTRINEWSPADTLRAVATYLERHGHHQGSYYDRTDTLSPATPPACVVGGIGIVIHGSAEVDPESAELPGADDVAAARDLLIDHLVDIGELRPPVDFGDTSALFDWNDDTWRTGTDIVIACHAAARDYDRRHHTGGAA